MGREDAKLLALALAVFVPLVIVGWAIRHSMAYGLQMQRGRLAVASIPREKLVPWLAETLRTDPSAARRTTAASFLQHFREDPGAARALLQALSDPDPTVQASAWDSLNRPRCAFRYDCVSEATRSIPTEEFLAALRSTRVEPARKELLEYVVYSRREWIDEALRIVVARGQLSDSGACALYEIGWAGYPTGLVSDPEESPIRARSIAREGLANPDPWMHRECLKFLLALGGDGLGEEDLGWVVEAADDPGLLCQGLTALGTKDGFYGRLGERAHVDPSGLAGAVGLIEAVKDRFGVDRAVPFARAGTQSDVLDVSVTCRRWLIEHGREVTDDSPE